MIIDKDKRLLMKMDKVANSKNDEYYTPAYAIEPLLPFLKPQSKIWCPFDTEESLFVSMLKDQGHSVINSHIKYGQDFFEFFPVKDSKNNENNENSEDLEDIDYIVSNPPYSIKTEILTRLFELKIPFAMLLSSPGIFESQKRFNLFKDNDFELMYFNRRVSYLKSYEDTETIKNPPFSSVYVCSGVLDDKIVFSEIDRNNVIYNPV